jgi:hypothetical protein
MSVCSTVTRARSRRPGSAWAGPVDAYTAGAGCAGGGSEPLDQYIVRHPDFFPRCVAGACPHRPRPAVGAARSCALRGIRAAVHDRETFSERVSLDELAAYLADEGVLHREDGHWHWVADELPGQRGVAALGGRGQFRRHRPGARRRQIIAEVDFSSAPETLYEGAIYMVQSSPYQVERARLGRAQGLRQSDARRLLHRCRRLHPAEDPRALCAELRQQRASHTARSTWSAFRRLQEDPLLHAREHRLRQHQPAGPGDAHQCASGGRSAPGCWNRPCHPARWRWTGFSVRPMRCTMSQPCSR